MSFSLGAISESTSEMEKASRMSEINFGVSLVFWGKQEINQYMLFKETHFKASIA